MFAITHPEKGIYLGNINGTHLWSKINGADHEAAPLFEDEFRALNQVKGQIEPDEAQWDGYSFAEVAVTGNLKSPRYATRAALEQAGLGDLVGSMKGTKTVYVITHPELGVYCSDDISRYKHSWTFLEREFALATTFRSEARAQVCVNEIVSELEDVTATDFTITPVEISLAWNSATKRDLERAGLGAMVATMDDLDILSARRSKKAFSPPTAEEILARRAQIDAERPARQVLLQIVAMACFQGTIPDLSSARFTYLLNSGSTVLTTELTTESKREWGEDEPVPHGPREFGVDSFILEAPGEAFPMLWKRDQVIEPNRLARVTFSDLVQQIQKDILFATPNPSGETEFPHRTQGEIFFQLSGEQPVLTWVSTWRASGSTRNLDLAAAQDLIRQTWPDSPVTHDWVAAVAAEAAWTTELGRAAAQTKAAEVTIVGSEPEDPRP